MLREEKNRESKQCFPVLHFFLEKHKYDTVSEAETGAQVWSEQPQDSPHLGQNRGHSAEDAKQR